MTTANASSSPAVAIEGIPAPTGAEVAAKLYKRYEGLMMVRTKAIKGKGAWYWAHLEPILVSSSDSGDPKAVKLRCSLCAAVFSASNPSRTASEHLKRGTCPNFSSPSATAAADPKPISALPLINSRKRSCAATVSYEIAPLALIDPFAGGSGGGDGVYSSSSTPPPPPHLLLSGGKDDLGALAMLEDSVKKLKSPKESTAPSLSKEQIEAAISFLADWFYESAGAVSFSAVEHPKFRAFLHQVGVPPISRRELAGSRLDARYEESRAEADARIYDALFFQLAASGWKPRSIAGDAGGDSVVSLTVNLPNGTAVFGRALVTPCEVPSKYAEDVLWETVTDVAGGGSGAATRCAGIVSDGFKSSALRTLESRNPWMVNLSCQIHGVRSLIKDFGRSLSLFHNVFSKTSKIATFFNNSPARTIFHKYQIQELDRAALLRSPNASFANNNFSPDFTVLEDITAFARPLQLTVHDDSYKLLCLDNTEARELAEVIRDLAFWNDLEAASSLVKLVGGMIQEIETERPLVGQCLPLWEELRSKIKEWCARYIIEETAAVYKVFDERFKRNYHPAWSAAFILDPIYLIKDSSGKYLPPYKCLTTEQEKDVDKLITRLASREEAHIVLNELMKWRSEGMDPLYAQAVQVKQLDPATGKMRIANPQSSRLVWETCLSEEFGSLAKVAVRLIFLHATAGGLRCNPALLRCVQRHGRSRAGMERAQKMIFVAAQARLERREFSGDDEKDGDLFANGSGDVDLINEAFLDASSV